MLKELEELREDILKLMYENHINFKSIKEATGVSYPTVIKLIDSKETGEEISRQPRENLRAYCDDILEDIK